MLLLQRAPLRIPARLAAVLLLASVASAQLDLPSKMRERPLPEKEAVVIPRGKGGSVAPHLVCAVCGDRNYTTPVDPSAAGGVQSAWCNTCSRPRPHSAPKKAKDLALPDGTRGAKAEAVPGSGPKADKGSQGKAAPTPEAPPGPVPGADASRAGHADVVATILPVWQGVAALERGDDPVALRAVPTVLAFGESGLVSARGALSASHGPTVLTAARVLLRGGNAEDADRVVARLRERLPGSVGAELLGELRALDPVRATPRLFCELLDHSQYPLRSAAERALAANLDASVVPLLAPVLESMRGDARYRAVDLLARIKDPSTTDLLLGCIDDPRAKVAWRACEALARSTDEQVLGRLLALAFGERWILRESAYAILALVEREDYRLESTLGEDHVPALLRGLTSNDPFVSGACASALAGIGFRSARSTESPWLDRDVPERLVATVVGDAFFDDYSSLQVPALRRLKQIAGVSYGSEGPRWAEWWLESGPRFRASRAVLSVEDGEEGDLEVHFQSGGIDARAVALLGPNREDSGAAGEVFYLNIDEARDFLALLRREGALSSERLPGARGGLVQRGRKLEIRAGDQSKSFAFGPGMTEPWFDRATQMIDALVQRNLWQRYPHPVDHAGSRRKLWEAEHEWWRETRDDLERAIGLKGLVLARLPVLAPLDREADLDELERLYRQPLVAEISDFTQLLVLLHDERYYSPTARKLTALARLAAGLDGPLDALDTERIQLSNNLITLLHDQYDAAAGEDIAALIEIQGPAALRAAAVDERPLLRAIAASQLAGSDEDEDRALLLGLLADPDARVEIAAVTAAGRERVEEASIDILLRARGAANLEVKMAALRVLGYLGGEHALDALIAGLGDGDPDVRVAAAEGLAELSDPSVSALLVSLLRQGSSSAVFDPARRGLLNLGDSAWDDLFTAMRSSSPAARREAALLLAYQGRPEAASPLMRLLTENPEDALVANELAVLTCVDHRSALDPSDAWWAWWDDVRHDDAFAWFLAAAETREIHAPDPVAFEGGGSEEGIAFLIRVMAREEAWLVERARRELIRITGRDIGSLPARGVERDVWLGTLYEALIDSRE